MVETAVDTVKVLIDTLVVNDSTTVAVASHPWTGVLLSITIGVLLGLVYFVRK